MVDRISNNWGVRSFRVRIVSSPESRQSRGWEKFFGKDGFAAAAGRREIRVARLDRPESLVSLLVSV
jgi:hypothetical protein